MAIIRPFAAVRPRQDLASKIAALPYDVYSRKEAYEAVKGDRYSFLRIDRPETQFPEDQDMYADEVYEKAASMLQDMIEKGEFVQDGSPCFYVYELTMDGISQTGLVAASSVDDYLNDTIKKHENTRKEKEQDRIRHIDACNAQTGPIFLAYRESETVNTIIEGVTQNAPDIDFTAPGGVRHRTWTIADPDTIKQLIDEFDRIGNTYIADGHHRTASAMRVSEMRREKHPDYTGAEEFNYFLSVLFPADQLRILDYNRVIKTLNGLSKEEVLEKVGEKAQVEVCTDGAFAPKNKGEIGLLLEGQWYKLTAKQEFVSEDPVEGLDVAFLQREILEPVFGIKDPTTDGNIDFVGGIRGMAELERRCKADCVAAFSLYPTDIHELFAVADAGRLMPPKSTWFEPKLLCGLFIHMIEA